jgi:hypothetical protein
MDAKNRIITLGEMAARKNRGLSPFPSDQEWKDFERGETEEQETAAIMAIMDKSIEESSQQSVRIPATLELLDHLNEHLREINASENPSIAEAVSAIGRAFSSYRDVPDAEKKTLATELSQAIGPASKALGLRSKVDEIITVGSVIVVYRPTILNMKDDQKQKIRNAITAILTANPGADLVAIQDSIGITDVRIQRPTPPPPPDPGKYSDW